MLLRVMVVDDEPGDLNLIKSMAGRTDCEIVAIAASREAVELLETERFDGILLDALMPNLDGFELTKYIRNSPLNRKTPVVILAGLDDLDTMRRGFKAGARHMCLGQAS